MTNNSERTTVHPDDQPLEIKSSGDDILFKFNLFKYNRDFGEEHRSTWFLNIGFLYKQVDLILIGLGDQDIGIETVRIYLETIRRSEEELLKLVKRKEVPSLEEITQYLRDKS